MILTLTIVTVQTIALVFAAATRRSVVFFLVLATLLLSQNLVAMALLRSQLVPISRGDLLLLPKELGIALAFAITVLFTLWKGIRINELSRVQIFGIGYLLFLLGQFLVAPTGMETRLAGARALGMPVVLYLLGSLFRVTENHSRKIFHAFVVIAIALAMFGLVEAFVLPPEFWLALGHEEYYQMKVGRPIQGALYNNMRYWLIGFDEPLRRVASITGDPLVSSYPMAFASLALLSWPLLRYRLRIGHLLLGVPIFSAMILTFSRGALLTVLIGAALMLLARTRERYALLVCSALASIILVVVFFGDALLRITTGAGHVAELRSGLELALRYPLGLGLGTAGSVAAGVAHSSGRSEVLLAGGDSFLGSVGTQTGIVGLVLFVAALLSIGMQLVGPVRRRGRQVGFVELLRWSTAAYLGGIIATSAVNESGLGVIASGLVFFLSGALTRHRAKPPPRQITVPSRDGGDRFAASGLSRFEDPTKLNP